MPYVMMPVPEEHVAEVMDFVLRAIAKASIIPWDNESVTDVFAELDEASRSILSFVSRSVLADKDISEQDLAGQVQLNPRELAGIVNELIARSRTDNRPNLVYSRGITERLPNGRTRDTRVYLMDPELAKLVREVEKADLLGATSPLGEAAQ
jgi:hypothetical protein